MIKLLFAAIVSIVSFSAAAFAELSTYEIIKEKSSLKFYAIQNNAPIEGQFKQFDADITFDPENPEKGKIIASVNVGTVSASYEEVVKNLKLPEWFSTEKFPTAVFKSKTITRMPMSDNYIAEGELTLRDITKPVTLNFQMTPIDAKTALAKGYATIHRNQFGVGQGEWVKDNVVKNEVRVEFRIVASKK